MGVSAGTRPREDPRTGLPAIYCENDSEGKYIATQVPQRLPTIARMTSVILSDEIVWIATEDHGLGWLLNAPVSA